MTMDSSTIKGIAVEFQQHTAAAYRQAHHKLNAQYAGIITDIADLFSNVKQPNIPMLVQTKVVELMNLPNNNDITRAKQMFTNGVMTLK